MSIYVEFEKLKEYKRDPIKQGVYISFDKDKNWYVLYKNYQKPILKKFESITEATKFIHKQSKKNKIHDAFERPIGLSI